MTIIMQISISTRIKRHHCKIIKIISVYLPNVTNSILNASWQVVHLFKRALTPLPLRHSPHNTPNR